MAIDSRQKRMSAMHLASPWRGPLVDAPAVGVAQGKRQAAAFMYSGILAGAAVAVTLVRRTIGMHRSGERSVDLEA